MLPRITVLGLLSLVLANTPVLALTKQQKLETCTFGADSQKLAGEARKAFLSRCMADEERPGARGTPSQPK